ncbi:MAG: hypothetical protein NC250_05270 [Alistipes senegalensis]|nr:hypothetical protein [Bacteroides cellulosilyticus]MCM1352121.1 hypothetical protein [Alistipes senegalensis]
MIKKLIGLLAAAGIIAVLVSTVLYRDEYRSMVFEEGTSLRDFFGWSKSDVEPATEPASVVVEYDYAGEGFDEEEAAGE